MKQMIRYLGAENKRAWKIFPKMLLQAIVLAFITGTVAFCAAGLLYKNEPVEIRVAVVVEEENQLTDFALDYVAEAEENVEFVVCSATEAFKGLEKNEFAAVIVLAKQLVEGILSGENPSVAVFCREDISLAGGLLKELTKAGAKMLSVAQAEIYAVYELAREFDAESGLQNFQDTLNRDNLGMALGRGGMFQYENVSATGNLPIKKYYAASAVTALLLFFAMPMGMFLKQDSKAVFVSFERVGIGAFFQQGIRFLTVMGIYGVLLLFVEAVGISGKIPGLFTEQGGETAAVKAFFVMWLTAASMAAFVLLVYEWVEKKSSAVFLLALLTVLLLFLSGGIIPKVFLPAEVRSASAWLVSNFWLDSIGSAMDGIVAGEKIGKSLLYGVLFFGLAVYGRKRKWS